MRKRSRQLENYHRDLSRRATHRANHRMRERFVQEEGSEFAKRVRRMRHRAQTQVARGWSPLVGWWSRGVGMRLRDSDAVLLANDQYEPVVREIVTRAVVEEILENPAPFVRAILEDQVLTEEPFHEVANKSLLERLRDRIGWR